MIYTSSYTSLCLNKYITVSISGDRGKGVNYQGKCYPKLAPKLSFWKIWHDNIGKISEEENNRFYIQEYYNKVLSKLDPEKVYDELEHSVLLCYEVNTEFCHRHIVAAWFEILLDKKIPEIKESDNKIEEVERPEYIKRYLEDVMRLGRKMRGFKSFRALNLFEKGEELETLADKYDEKGEVEWADLYRQHACYYRCEADMAEEEYCSKK